MLTSLSNLTRERSLAPRSPFACQVVKSHRMTKSPVTVLAHPDVDEILLDEKDLQSRIVELGRQLAIDYKDKKPLIIGTLKGAVIFISDLIRSIDPVPEGLQMDFVRASSYGSGTISSGSVNLSFPSSAHVVGRHVIVVEDIVDSGRTATALSTHFRKAGVASCAVVALLSKPSRREVEYDPEYVGFVIDDHFVVGYGLDYDEKYRSLPYVGVLKPSVYCE